MNFFLLLSEPAHVREVGRDSSSRLSHHTHMWRTISLSQDVT